MLKTEQRRNMESVEKELLNFISSCDFDVQIM